MIKNCMSTKEVLCYVCLAVNRYEPITEAGKEHTRSITGAKSVGCVIECHNCGKLTGVEEIKKGMMLMKLGKGTPVDNGL